MAHQHGRQKEDTAHMLYSYERGPKPCFHMRDTGACPFGDSCQFSHDSEVLRRAAAVASAADRGEPAFSQPAWSKGPWNRKTKLCKSFKQWGACQYGQACKFAHGPEELRVFDGWDPDVGKEDGEDEEIPCIPENVSHGNPPDHLSGVDHQLLTASDQGVSIGDGWVRYWDDVHHANYYFHPGTWAREGRRERVINNALYALSALSYAGIFTCRIAYAMPGMPYVQSIMPPDCLCDAWYALCAVYNASGLPMRCLVCLMCRL
eukprot:Tamp_22990.p1 GENE.Tamp_22990~~Tamp_22990.p1  ORF type:complete len:262 (+),score=12.16 Tamp_22990:131-916(+)